MRWTPRSSYLAARLSITGTGCRSTGSTCHVSTTTWPGRKPKPWVDAGFYPFEERLINDADKGDEAIFMVDMGGGKGNDIAQILRKYPNLPGGLVLEDQEDVIADATGLDPRIQTLAHDFFKP